MKRIKRNKTAGITLIALVVTIIVLLLLAGISIQMITGNNGIITRTEFAKNKSIAEQEKEKIKLAFDSALMDNVDSLKVTESTLKNEFEKMEGVNKVSVVQTEENEFEIYFEDSGNGYLKSTNNITQLSAQSIKKATAYTYGPKHDYTFINVLYGKGKLVRQKTNPTEPTGYVELREEKATVISENVKDYIDDNTIMNLFYRTKDNKLYYYNETTSILIGVNVIRYEYYNSINRLYYIDQSNNLYEFKMVDESVEKISDNAQNFFIENYLNPNYPVFYVDNTNNLYAVGERLVSNNVKSINQYITTQGKYSVQFITNEDSIYEVKYGNSNVDGYDNFDTILLGENVKETYGEYYIDQNNNIRKCWIDNWQTVLASNVKTFIGYDRDKFFYLDQNGALFINDKKIEDNVKYVTKNHYIDRNDNFYYFDYYEKVLISDNVEKYYNDGGYLKKDKTFVKWDNEIENVEEYYPDSLQLLLSNGKRIYLYNNEEVIKSGENWYQDVNDKIYYKHYNINDVGL